MNKIIPVAAIIIIAVVGIAVYSLSTPNYDAIIANADCEGAMALPADMPGATVEQQFSIELLQAGCILQGAFGGQ